MKRTLALGLMLLLLTGCGNAQPNKETKTVYAMDTVMTLTAYGDEALTAEALEEGEREIHHLDAMLSVSNESGDVFRLNRDKAAEVSQETAALLDRALSLAAETDGDFDLTVYPLMELWGFTGEVCRVPTQAELNECLPAVGYEQVYAEGETVSLPENGGIDLGGIAKGYTAEQVLAAMAEEGVESAIISLGGNVGTLGLKPDGSNWTVAVENPDKSGDYLGTISLGAGCYAITSGAYERYFEQDGKRYHHILDPKTGYPAESGLESVTIVSRDGTLADALSTALFVKGVDEAADFWRAHQAEFDMILYDGETLYVTPGLALDTTLPMQEVTP